MQCHKSSIILLKLIWGGNKIIKIIVKTHIDVNKVEAFKASAKELVEKSSHGSRNISYSLNMNT
jgi:hypothetical protein